MRLREYQQVEPVSDKPDRLRQHSGRSGSTPSRCRRSFVVGGGAEQQSVAHDTESIEASVALLEAQPATAPLASLASAAVEGATGRSCACETLSHAEAAAKSFPRAARTERPRQHTRRLIHDGARVLAHSKARLYCWLSLALKAGKSYADRD